jgi:hypothetical protein
MAVEQSYLRFVEGEFNGAVHALVATVTGVFDMVTQNPMTIVMNIAHFAEHPIAAIKKIKELPGLISAAVTDACSSHGYIDSYSIGSCIGNAAAQLGLIFLTGGGSEAAEVGKIAEDGSATFNLVSKSRDVSLEETLNALRKEKLVKPSDYKRLLVPEKGPVRGSSAFFQNPAYDLDAESAQAFSELDDASIQIRAAKGEVGDEGNWLIDQTV